MTRRLDPIDDLFEPLRTQDLSEGRLALLRGELLRSYDQRRRHVHQRRWIGLTLGVFLLGGTVVGARSGWRTVQSFFGVLEKDGVTYEVELRRMSPDGSTPTGRPTEGPVLLRDRDGNEFWGRLTPIRDSSRSTDTERDGS